MAHAAVAMPRPEKHTGTPHPVSGEINLTSAEARALLAVAQCIHVNPIDHPDDFCDEAARLARALPHSLTLKLLKFREVGSETGAMVVEGLLIGDVPDTPPNNKSGLGGRTDLANQVALLSYVLGEMVSYEAEGNGFLLQDMVPNRKLAKTQQSQGSKKALEAHTEQCFSDLRPDYVVLGCLRGDPKAETFAFSAREVVSHLKPKEIKQLRKRHWTTRIDASFQPYVPNPDEVRGPIPILSGPAEDPMMLIDQDLMHGITDEAQTLLEKVIDIYISNRNSHVLVPGEVLFVDNRRAMHGRSSFKPKFDGSDRFIVRGFIVIDLERSGPARQGHPHQIGAEFS